MLVITIALCCMCQSMGARRASNRMHQRYVRQLFAAPISFFTTTENGQIQNRLSDVSFVKMLGQPIPEIINSSKNSEKFVAEYICIKFNTKQ